MLVSTFPKTLQTYSLIFCRHGNLRKRFMHKIWIYIMQIFWFTSRSFNQMKITISQSNQSFHLHVTNSKKYYIISARIYPLIPHFSVSKSWGRLPISQNWFIQWILQGGGWVEAIIQLPTTYNLLKGSWGRKICWFGACFWPFWGCEGVPPGHRWVI